MQVQLRDPDLGILELGCDPYVVTAMQIGSPAVRDVTRNRALADGAFDETRYLGPRAVTVSLRLKNSTACEEGERPSMTTLRDRVTPYMSPRLRPYLVWQEPSSDQIRYMQVRGVSWPFAFDGPKYPTLALQWVCPSGEIWDGTNGAEPTCVDITPSSEVEAGRTYDLTFDRVYPPGAPIGGRRVDNPGNWHAHWTLTIYGACTNPEFTINGIGIDFDQQGGVDINGGESLVIDTRDRTILYNGEPGQSRYDRSNFAEWSWNQLLLRPGVNELRFGADMLSPQATARLCFRPAYL